MIEKVKNEKLEINRIMKKQFTPICAIYALLNGIYADNKKTISKSKFKKIAKEIWKLAICEDDLPSEEPFVSDDLIYSLIGEFFNSKQLYKFLKDKKDKINKLLKIYNITGVEKLSLNSNSDVLSYDSITNGLKNIKKNELYLIPFNASSPDSENNFHWISFGKLKDGKLSIFNSNDEAMKNVLNNSCIKCSSKPPRIKNLDDLVKVYREMLRFDRDDKECSKEVRKFDFQKWAKNKKWLYCIIRCYPSEVRKRIENLKKGSYNCSFSKSSFEIIKVTYEKE